jgi:hypothetical protein
MTKPIKPSSSSASTGEGKSFLERMQRGMANDPTANPEKAKMFAEKLEKYVNEGKALNEARNEHKKVLGLSRAGGGAGGDFSGMKGLDKPFKAGGKVSEASHKKALEKAGFYDKGKTKSEREKIVSKVTTKPQRLGMVEKLFSTKKMNSGGMASKRADGCAIKGKTRA